MLSETEPNLGALVYLLTQRFGRQYSDKREELELARQKWKTIRRNGVMALTITMVKTSDLIPYEKNPRKNDKGVDAVANSIKAYGFKVPIVISSDNVVVTGHTRLKAAKSWGLKKYRVLSRMI